MVADEVVGDAVRPSFQFDEASHGQIVTKSLLGGISSLHEIELLNWDLMYFLLRKFLESILAASAVAILVNLSGHRPPMCQFCIRIGQSILQ